MRPDLSRRLAAAVLASMALALVVTACTEGPDDGPNGSPADPGALRVVATTTVFADLVRQVGGPDVVVSSLVPPGGEVHTFDPTPSDLTAVADADLVVMNGLGLDDWLASVVPDSGSSATLVRLGEDLEGVEYLAGGEGEPVNPHLWLDAAYGAKYAQRIGDALAELDPESAAAIADRTTAYVDRLEELDALAAERIGAIPEADRRIVSFHEAFPYFAAAYGLEIVGTVVDAPGQDPSAGEIAALVESIRESGARAIFSEVQFSPELSETIARETGIPVESNLYNDSLGDPPADTYEGMIRWDVDRVVEALTR